MNNFKTFGIPTIVLFTICLIATLLLAVTNSVTAPKIDELALKTEEASRKLVLSCAERFKESKKINLNGTEYTYYEGVDASGKCAGFVFSTAGKGYGGDVKIMTGIDSAGAVTGVETLELNETAGLGMKAKNKSFLNQYLGKSGEVFVSKDKPGESSIDALTGATVTSRAVTTAVNTALDLYAEIKGGGQ